ncbi:MAG: carbamoyltransferase HypF [Anaerolineae bacterium]|nr:carbamoyltransferase HypF [Anaerolineae bacterium]
MAARIKVYIQGVVQGVGFRPFVYRLANELGLKGWVNNSAQGVWIEAEGADQTLRLFLQRLETDKPPHALIQTLRSEFLPANGYQTFEIRHSASEGEKTALILPDLATCPACLQEILDPTNRRYLYPFTNCTHCGPRFTIIQALPYDRPNTTMSHFEMCEDCRAEYENPADRRFHAQPNACPKCGPHLELWDKNGTVLAQHHDALLMAADAIRNGQLVAVKGVGGFHLMVDARNENAVSLLRQRKHRPSKPLALMFPSLESIKKNCEVSELEEKLLTSSEAPIVLLRRYESDDTAPAVAPDNRFLGVMLPYSPLHHLLMAELNFPVVATSGNLSDEPICINEHEAIDRLSTIADIFLVHNRPIHRHVDDSIVRVMSGREQIVRRARGYAPLPIQMEKPMPVVLAVGAHLKNTVAISSQNQIFISQHIGDLETAQSLNAFQQVIRDFQNLYELQPQAVACDMHPDYLSTQFARTTDLPLIPVQHHYAHVLACMAEHGLTGTALGISWDGTGYGLDGTVWGGEFLRITEKTFERVALLRPFALAGGDKAVKEPRRSALGLLYEMYGESLFEQESFAPIRAFSPNELSILRTMLVKGIHSPRTSSAGRLFDAVASLLDVCQRVSFEGEAAVALEYHLNIPTDEFYDFSVAESVVDWQPMIEGILTDIQKKLPLSLISAKFHNTLVEMMINITRQTGEITVVLTGGCFQNKYLSERAVLRLQEEHFRPYWHQRIPPNDGGIALGQIIAALKE